MKDLKATRGRGYILGLIAQGEHEHQDFKYAISDARKIARSISAFANNGGGHLLIGVKDNGVIAGVKNEEDIYVVEQAGWRYCDPPQDIEFAAFNTGDTGVVIRASVSESPDKPVRVDEGDGRKRAYYRVADENIAAHPLMVRMWLDRKHGFDQAFCLSDADNAILSAIKEKGMISVDAALHLSPDSRRTIEATIVRLASLDIIRFVHTPQGFMLAI